MPAALTPAALPTSVVIKWSEALRLSQRRSDGVFGFPSDVFSVRKLLRYNIERKVHVHFTMLTPLVLISKPSRSSSKAHSRQSV